MGEESGAFEISFTRHIQAVILGVSTAVASAVIPAMSAARMPVKIALSSRQPTPGGSGKWNPSRICLRLDWVVPGYLRSKYGSLRKRQRR